MHKVGIDRISFYTPRYYIDLVTLAQARGVDAERFKKAVGQEKMAVPSPDEDVVTMAANAVAQVLQDVDLTSIDTLFFATESGVDQSKAAGLFVHELLSLPKQVRVVELKQACYSATAILRFVLPFLQINPHKRIILVASDIARYGLGSHAESSQGAGAVAMMLSANPRLIALEPESGVCSISAMDFWRPNYCDEAFVDGIASSKLYLKCLEDAWHTYQQQSGRQLQDHAYFCFHVPVAKLVEKGFKHLMKLGRHGVDYNNAIDMRQIEVSLHYNRIIGNCYTAALYLALCSLLDYNSEDLANKRIGFYSYGSGCVAEFFSGIVQPGYQTALLRDSHQQLIQQRTELTFSDYEKFYLYPKAMQGQDYHNHNYEPGKFRFIGITQHKRLYEQA